MSSKMAKNDCKEDFLSCNRILVLNKNNYIRQKHPELFSISGCPFTILFYCKIYIEHSTAIELRARTS